MAEPGLERKTLAAAGFDGSIGGLDARPRASAREPQNDVVARGERGAVAHDLTVGRVHDAVSALEHPGRIEVGKVGGEAGAARGGTLERRARRRSNSCNQVRRLRAS